MRFLIPLFLAWSATAQLPIVPFTVSVSSSTPTPIPQQIAGLTEWWYYVDSLATNASVTNWVGRIQGTILTNGASAKQPTNSSSGIGFTQTGPAQLTNINLSIGTNWTSVVYFKQTRMGDFSHYCIWGEAGDDFLLGTLNQAPTDTRAMYENHAGVDVSPTGFFAGVNTFTCLAMVMSNNVAAGGLTYFYTNGIFAATGAADNTVTQIGTVGYQPFGAANTGNSAFNGFIKQIILYTNNLSALNISNLYFYCTNSP